MKKVLLIALALIMVLAPITRAEGQADPMAEAQKSFQPFELDGEEAKIGGYLINANNYYKLRDLAALLDGTDKQFNIVFDDVKKQIALELGKPYEKLDTDLQEMKHDKTTAKMVTNTILVDGKEVELKAALIDRNNYVKLRDLGPVVGFKVDYNRETRAIIVDTKSEAKVEEKAEEKTEDKKEEKAEDKKPEEKKDEKKDEVKTTDPNATAEEIKAFLADPKLTNDYSLSDSSEFEEEDGAYYLKSINKDGEEYFNQIVKYLPLSNKEVQDRIKVQTEYWQNSANSLDFSMDQNFRVEFLKRERFTDDKIQLMALLDCMNFRINQNQRIAFDLNTKTGDLLFVVEGKNKAGEKTITGSAVGKVEVFASYDDGTEITGSDIGDYRTIPLVRGDNKAKLKSIMIMYFAPNQQVFGNRIFII